MSGFGDIQPRTFRKRFDSFDGCWDNFEASDILRQQYDALPADQLAEIRGEIVVMGRCPLGRERAGDLA